MPAFLVVPTGEPCGGGAFVPALMADLYASLWGLVGIADLAGGTRSPARASSDWIH